MQIRTTRVLNQQLRSDLLQKARAGESKEMFGVNGASRKLPTDHRIQPQRLIEDKVEQLLLEEQLREQLEIAEEGTACGQQLM